MWSIAWCAMTNGEWWMTNAGCAMAEQYVSESSTQHTTHSTHGMQVMMRETVWKRWCGGSEGVREWGSEICHMTPQSQHLLLLFVIVLFVIVLVLLWVVGVVFWFEGSAGCVVVWERVQSVVQCDLFQTRKYSRFCIWYFCTCVVFTEFVSGCGNVRVRIEWDCDVWNG